MATLSVEPVRVDEGGYLYFEATLSEPVSETVVVSYRTGGGTAVSETDFNQTDGTLTFDPGETSKLFYVYIYRDLLSEADENFLVELYNPVGATFIGSNLTQRSAGWILDDEVTGGSRAVAVIAPDVVESSGRAKFTISLSDAFDSATTLQVKTVAGSALAGSDFVADSDAITFNAGQTEASYWVQLKNDFVAEAAETFGLAVTGPGVAAYGQATIHDTDARLPTVSISGDRVEEGSYAYFTINLSKPSTSAVEVSYRTAGGTTLHDVDVNSTYSTVEFAAGETSKQVYVYSYSDREGEADESFELELYNPVGATFGGRNLALSATSTLLDNDVAGGDRSLFISTPTVVEGSGEAVFTVTLSEAFDTRQSLGFATISGSARSGSDFTGKSGQLVFAAGQTEAKVVVNLKNDGTSELGETFGLKVKGAGLAAYGQAELLDDDGSLPVVSVQGDRAQEGDYLYFTVRLSEASKSSVAVNYQTSSGTATNDVDLNATSGTLTFEAGETTKTVYVYTYSDSLSELDEAFNFQLSSPVGANFGPANRAPSATGWILDDDPGAQKRVLVVSDVAVLENAGRANFTINVSQPLEEDLVIRYSTVSSTAKADKDFVAGSGRITLTAGATEAVVSIALKDDRIDERDESFKLKLWGFDKSELAPSGNDVTATARIIDNDPSRALAHEHDFLI